MSILSAPAAWIGAIAYLFQIYFDFSGYSDMAIGLSRMFGFTFPENFRYPYAALGIKDFWRRWHISLSGWFRDYLYIPLGGNRKGKVRTWLNQLIVFFCTGLWHGANVTFIVWGLFHGALLIAESSGLLNVRKWRVVIVANKLDKLKAREIEPNLAQIRETLHLRDDELVIPFSAEKGTGKEQLIAAILDHLND